MATGKDARVEPRKILRCSAKVVLANGTQVKGRTIDVSMSGISIMLYEPIAAAQTCTILFEAPAGSKVLSINVPGKAVYCTCVGTDGFRVGFQFDLRNDVVAKTIRQLLQ
jgi:hypothetical protein